MGDHLSIVSELLTDEGSHVLKHVERNLLFAVPHLQYLHVGGHCNILKAQCMWKLTPSLRGGHPFASEGYIFTEWNIWYHLPTYNLVIHFAKLYMYS